VFVSPRFAGVLLAAVVALFATIPTPAHAAVTPASFEATMKPGESTDVAKTVDVPDFPRRLDLQLIVDLTGSYSDDLPRIKALAPGIFDDVRATASDSLFGLSTFVDFPFGSWGVPGEWGYRLEQQLTDSRSTWLGSVNAMSSRYGNDGPEAQYESLYQTVTGAGREMPPTTDGDYDDPGEIKPGQQAAFRTQNQKVIAITTDSEFHNHGDGGGPFPYPGPTRDEVVNALNARNIRVVAIKAPGSTSQMDDVANATRGAVVTTSNTSAEIGQAITSGLGALKFLIRPIAEPECAPLDVTFDPASIDNVDGGTTVNFRETIKVPEGTTAAQLPPDGIVHCVVRFRAGTTPIGAEAVTIHVILNQPPDCSPVTPSVATLVPPDHKWRIVRLTGATDPDGDPVALHITGVTQDEPLVGQGTGATTPDARLGSTSDRVYVRQERAGTGDGRVYTISFEGSDGKGGTCTGAVTVTVPRGSKPAVDSGQTVDSLGT
jgi:hypothetical protein